MAEILLTAVMRGISTIDRTMSEIVLRFWVSTLEREIGTVGDVENYAD